MLDDAREQLPGEFEELFEPVDTSEERLWIGELPITDSRGIRGRTIEARPF